MHPQPEDDHYYVSGYSAEDDPCVYENGVLRNLLDIQTTAELLKAEGELATVRIAQLASTPTAGNFDLDHIKAIHRHIFQDIYAWAGTARSVDLSKGETVFLRHSKIPEVFAAIHQELVAENMLHGFSAEAFIQRAAYYLGSINIIHPFREGNGRTQREYLQQLANGAGFRIQWTASGLAMKEACIEFIEKKETRQLCRIIRTGLSSI